MEVLGKHMFMLLWALGCHGPVEAPVDDVETGDSVDTTDSVDPVDTDTVTDTMETADIVPPAPDCVLGSSPPENQTGSHAFTPLVDGQDVQSTRGAQPGQHIWGSVICTGIHPGTGANPLDPSMPHVDFWIEQGGVSIGGYHDLPRPMQREWGTGLIGDQLVLWVNEYWDTVGLDLTIRFHVRDVNGVEVDRSVRVHTIADPAVPPPSDTDTVDTDVPVP